MAHLTQELKLAALYSLTGAALLISGCAQSTRMIVKLPIVNLRSNPNTYPESRAHDPTQETQLLYGEEVRISKIVDGWAKIEAIEQSEWTHKHRWQGYPGWLPEEVLAEVEISPIPYIVITDKWIPVWSDAFLQQRTNLSLPMGTRLPAKNVGGQRWQVELFDGTHGWIPYKSAKSLRNRFNLPLTKKRIAIIRSAEKFIGDPYFWGGRSPYNPSLASSSKLTSSYTEKNSITGIDCSGLTNLAYRTVGIDIPRDAHEQFLRVRSVQELLPADLIFLSAKNNPKQIVHVMLYAGNGEIIEGPGTGLKVRRISLNERLGSTVENLSSSSSGGGVIDNQTIYFGTYIPKLSKSAVKK